MTKGSYKFQDNHIKLLKIDMDGIDEQIKLLQKIKEDKLKEFGITKSGYYYRIKNL